MAKQKQRNRPRQQSQPKHKHKVGDLIYLHAFADPQDEKSYFLCKGYITRQPTTDSPVYKIAIISVDPNSVLCGEQPDTAKRILGRTIAKKEHEITTEPTGWMKKLYNRSVWLEIESKQLGKIKAKIQRQKENK